MRGYGYEPLFISIAAEDDHVDAHRRFAATLDDATGLMSLYVNGALAAQTTTDVRPFANLDPTQEPGVGIGNSNALDNYNVPFNGFHRSVVPWWACGVGYVLSPEAAQEGV